MNNRTFIIAEAGVNHNGNLETAYKLIDAAKAAGVDAVKFQTFTAKNIISKFAPKADYQKETTDAEESQYEMIKKLELSKEDHQKLFEYCEKKQIDFLSTPFDLDSIDLLTEIGIKAFKVSSGEITNYPYLKKIAEKKLPIMMSTGMANMGEIEWALDILVKNGLDSNNISILHCNTEYPTPYEDVNLNAMITIENAFKLPVGYSDHSLGIEVPIAAVAMGATIIEKHFTLDRKSPGPDHRASLEPDELKAMVKAIRNIEKAMGDGIKQPSKSELKNILIARKSIVANCDIAEGGIFSENNLAVKRPGNGISPMRWDEIIGRKANRDFKEDELIEI